MKIEQSYVQKCKVAVHTIQALFIFIAACVTIAILTKDGGTDGSTKWYFALCFLCIPALIYFCATPMWPRAVKFANAYAFLALDVVICIFWLSAFVSVAMYNARGIRQGAIDKKLDENAGNCTTFAFGPEDKCNLNRAAIGLGGFIFALFLLSTAISAYYFVQFRKTGEIPGIGGAKRTQDASGLEAQKDVWDADTHEIGQQDNDTHSVSDHEGQGNDPYDYRGGYGSRQEDDEYALLHSTETEDGRHPGRPLSWGEDRRYEDNLTTDTGYHGASNTGALSPDGFASYPKGNYSFSSGNER